MTCHCRIFIGQARSRRSNRAYLLPRHCSAAVIFSPLAYPDYRWLSQAVSDLSAETAPSGTLWIQLSALYMSCGIVCCTVSCIAAAGKYNKILRLGIYLYNGFPEKTTRRVHDAKSNSIICVRRDIDVDCRRKFRFFRSMALRCVNLGRSFWLPGCGFEFQKPERQIKFSVHTRRTSDEQIQCALGVHS